MVKRSWPPQSLAVRLVALGLLGVVLALPVVWSAVEGFRDLGSSASAQALVSRAERYHQDADQAHDALHADVLQVLEASGFASRAPAEAVLRRDAVEYRLDIERAGRLPLSRALTSALGGLRHAEFAYADRALDLGRHALGAEAGPERTSGGFEDEFGRLKRAKPRSTDDLGVLSVA